MGAGSGAGETRREEGKDSFAQAGCDVAESNRGEARRSRRRSSDGDEQEERHIEGMRKGQATLDRRRLLVVSDGWMKKCERWFSLRAKEVQQDAWKRL